MFFRQERQLSLCSIRVRCCWDLGIVLPRQLRLPKSELNLPCFHEDYLCSSVSVVEVPALAFLGFAIHLQKLLSDLDIDADLQCIFLLFFFQFTLLPSFFNFSGNKSKHFYQILSIFLSHKINFILKLYLLPAQKVD